MMEQKDKIIPLHFPVGVTFMCHEIRKFLRLSMIEYCVLDVIYTVYRMDGWCEWSKKEMAEHLNISREHLYVVIKKLIERSFLIKDEKTSFLKTSSLWNDLKINQ